jgi:hypothetical protein
MERIRPFCVSEKVFVGKADQRRDLGFHGKIRKLPLGGRGLVHGADRGRDELDLGGWRFGKCYGIEPSFDFAEFPAEGSVRCGVVAESLVEDSDEAKGCIFVTGGCLGQFLEKGNIRLPGMDAGVVEYEAELVEDEQDAEISGIAEFGGDFFDKTDCVLRIPALAQAGREPNGTDGSVHEGIDGIRKQRLYGLPTGRGGQEGEASSRLAWPNGTAEFICKFGIGGPEMVPGDSGAGAEKMEQE